MQLRRLTLATLIPLATLAACSNNNDNTSTGTTGGTATVRLVNATGTNLDIATNGTVGSGNGNLAYGASGACTTVNATTPALAIRNAGSTSALSGLTTNFTPGGNYTIVAYPGATGTTQFATVSSAFTPTSGNAGLRVFNAASGFGPYDVYVAAPTAALGATANASNLAFGGGTTFFNVGSGSQQVRLTNAGTTTVTNVIGNTFTAGGNSTLILAPPATGTTTLRSFFASGC